MSKDAAVEAAAKPPLEIFTASGAYKFPAEGVSFTTTAYPPGGGGRGDAKFLILVHDGAGGVAVTNPLHPG
jgi:hypothetical protein